MTWEVDWTHADNTGSHVMARNLASRQLRTRQWHKTSTGVLREMGIKTPVYRKDSWEVNWEKRQGKMVLITAVFAALVAVLGFEIQRLAGK